MRLDEYLQEIETPPSTWAKKNNIRIPTITRYLKGEQGLSVATVRKIMAATGGKVSFEDLTGNISVNEDNGGGVEKSVRKKTSVFRRLFFFISKSDN